MAPDSCRVEGSSDPGGNVSQQCLDDLEGLIVLRMFELTKMNMSQTGV